MTHEPHDEQVAAPDGGPAFPIHAMAPGLSKREWFAGLAMQGVMEGYEPGTNPMPQNELDDMVSDAFRIADAMLLAARGQP